MDSQPQVGQLDQLDAQLALLAPVVDRSAPGDPLLAELRANVAELHGALAGLPGAPSPAAARLQVEGSLRGFIDRWKRELGRELLKGLPELPPVQAALSAADWLSGDALTLPGDLGPLALRLGLESRSVSLGLAGVPALPVGPGLPEAIGATLRGPFPAEGALHVGADGIGGAMRVPLGAVSIDALASLRRLPEGGPSFLAILGVGFTPGIQLSFGFALNRVGGVIGIERRVDDQALGREVRSGAASQTLFAPSGANPLHRLETAERLFPPASGQHVVGPLFGLAWLSLGPDVTLVQVDLGVLVQFGGPVTIILVGSARLKLTELLSLQLDLAGSVDVGRGRIALDISIVEGRVLGAFRLSGDAAFRAVVQGEGAVLFSAGGFYPGFDPRPMEVGPLRRLSFGPDLPIPGFSLRVEGYLAVTSNTIQLGGRLDAKFDAVLVSATGSLGLDALVQFKPFRFQANVFGRFSVEALGRTFCGISVEGSISGPGPISLAARLTIETFLKDIDWNETFTFGDGQADQVVGIADLVEKLHERAGEAGLLKASAPQDNHVLLAPRPSGTKPLLSPLGTLIWSQRYTPLRVHCDRFQNAPLAPPGQGVDVEVKLPAKKLADEVDGFAPGAYLNLSESAALHVRGFEPHASGISIGFDSGVAAASVPQPPAIRLLILPLAPGAKAQDGKLRASHHGLFEELASRGLGPAKVSAKAALVTTLPDDFRTADGGAHTTLTAAWQHARYRAGGLPHHGTDPEIDVKAV